MLSWVGDDEFMIDGVSYRMWNTIREQPAPEAGQMLILKPRVFVERYVELVERMRPRNIVELGILAGGSTAFLAQIARPDRLVAVDLSTERVAALEQFIDAHGLRRSVSAHYGVDQSDTEQLTDLVVQEFAGAPLDLVVDDASHLLGPTRASFNCLFPRLRPGGAYLVEDWAWAHIGLDLAEDLREAVPLSVFVLELVLGCASAPKLIADVTVQRGWALVQRGPATVDPASFNVSECLDEVGRDMLAKLEPR